MILHPCRKCLVSPCCVDACQRYEKYITLIVFGCVFSGILTSFITTILPVILIKLYNPIHFKVTLSFLHVFWILSVGIYLVIRKKFYITRNLKYPLVFTIIAPVVFHILFYCFLAKKIYVQEYRPRMVKNG